MEVWTNMTALSDKNTGTSKTQSVARHTTENCVHTLDYSS